MPTAQAGVSAQLKKWSYLSQEFLAAGAGSHLFLRCLCLPSRRAGEGEGSATDKFGPGCRNTANFDLVSGGVNGVR